MKTRASATPPALSRRTELLLSSLSFYGAYHDNVANKAIHVLFVPCIWWSAAVALCAVPLPVATATPLSAAALLWLFSAAAYCYLEPLAGIVAALVYAALLVAAQRFYEQTEHALAAALAVHVVGWFAQIAVGHAIFEKRKPALLDNLAGALFLAPFFVVLEARVQRCAAAWHGSR